MGWVASGRTVTFNNCLFDPTQISVNANSNGGDDNFAFISNGELIVLGEGTLQVFDVIGHQLLTKELSTFHSPLSTSLFPAGVYVLRLTNGENVKTQKIVVK
ncbi:MAG: T9SS type A sorting domain-containing protein [Bacteroidales bacterium]|nr:T9SS type A sorting domain-containing protein [Bacteroidales bacterium]